MLGLLEPLARASSLEATFIDVKNMYLHWDKNPGLRNTGGDTCFSLQKKLLPVGGRSCKWLQKEASIAKYSFINYDCVSVKIRILKL